MVVKSGRRVYIVVIRKVAAFVEMGGQISDPDITMKVEIADSACSIA